MPWTGLGDPVCRRHTGPSAPPGKGAPSGPGPALEGRALLRHSGRRLGPWRPGTTGAPPQSPAALGPRVSASACWARAVAGSGRLQPRPGEGSWSRHSQDQPVASRPALLDLSSLGGPCDLCPTWESLFWGRVPQTSQLCRGGPCLGNREEGSAPWGVLGGGALSRVMGSCRTGWEPPLGDQV